MSQLVFKKVAAEEDDFFVKHDSTDVAGPYLESQFREFLEDNVITPMKGQIPEGDIRMGLSEIKGLFTRIMQDVFKKFESGK